MTFRRTQSEPHSALGSAEHDISADSLLRRMVTRHANADPFTALRDAAAGEEESNRRSATAWRRTVDRESASLTGLLISGVEHNSAAILTTVDAGTVIGALDVVGLDFVTVSESGGALTAVRSDRVVAIEFTNDTSGHSRGQVEPDDDREPSSKLSFHEFIRTLAGIRRQASVGTIAPTDAIVGRLWSCGTDICTIRRHGGVSTRTVHVPLHAISYVHIWKEALS